MTSTEMIAALARADRQFAHVREALATLMADAHSLQQRHGKVQAWALLSDEACRHFGCTTKEQRFAVEMLIAAVIQLNDA